MAAVCSALMILLMPEISIRADEMQEEEAVLWAQQNGITKGYTTGVNKGSSASMITAQEDKL